MQQPADLLINGVGGVLHHDVGIQAQLAFCNRLRHKRQRMRGRDGKDPANGTNLSVINAAAVEQRVRRTNGDIRLVVNDGIPDAVIHLGGDGDLASGKLFFQHLQQSGGVPWRIQKLINTDAHPRFNPL